MIVVDDRSTDGTPAMLATLADSDDRLQIERIDVLPPLLIHSVPSSSITW